MQQKLDKEIEQSIHSSTGFIEVRFWQRFRNTESIRTTGNTVNKIDAGF